MRFHFVVLALLLPLQVVAAKSLSGDRDILIEACKLHKSVQKRTNCMDAAERTEIVTDATIKSEVELPKKIPMETITYKGISLDQPGVRASLEKMCREIKHNNSCTFSERRNQAWVDYGHLNLNIGFFHLTEDGSLVKVEIGGFKAEILAMVGVLESKYGVASKNISQVENALGTKFDKNVFTWRDDQGSQIFIEVPYKKIDEGRIVIESASSVALREAVEKMQKESMKKNL